MDKFLKITGMLMVALPVFWIVAAIAFSERLGVDGFVMMGVLPIALLCIAVGVVLAVFGHIAGRAMARRLDE